jgi:hypothetical protein
MSWLENKAQSFENTRFGSMSWMIIVHCCLAGIAGSMALMHDNLIAIAIAAAIAMGANTIMIAQASGKLCVLSFYISVAFSSLLAGWYLLV